MASAPVEPPTNTAVVAAYNRWASMYDRLIAPLKTVTRRQAIRQLELEPGACVLELGCGPGHALELLAEAVAPNGWVIGLDAARGMLKRADTENTALESPDGIELIHGDARSIPIRDGGVDAIFVEDTLELFSTAEIDSVLAECHRALTDDGHLEVVTMDRATVEDATLLQTYAWLYTQIPGVNQFGCRPIDVHSALEATGFEIETHEQHCRGGVWPVDLLHARPI